MLFHQVFDAALGDLLFETQLALAQILESHQVRLPKGFFHDLVYRGWKGKERGQKTTNNKQQTLIDDNKISTINNEE